MRVGEALEQIAQINCTCPIAGGVQGLFGWGSEKLGIAKSVHGRGSCK